jgi:FkbM family methyltransferase
MVTNIILSRLKRINSCIGFKNKLLVTLLTVSEALLYGFNKILSRLDYKQIKLSKLLLVTDILIKNEDGIFLCRKRTWDIYSVDLRHEEDLREYFHLKKGVFVDIGAHVGKYSMKIARSSPDVKVVAIEADPETFRFLKRNVQINNLNNVIPVNYACYSKKTVLDFYKGTGSVLCKGNMPIRVKAEKLDTILKNLHVKKVNLIKLDVEGVEDEVLEGAKETLKRNDKLKIIFEAWSEEFLDRCKKILSTCGFSVRQIGQDYYLAWKE